MRPPEQRSPDRESVALSQCVAALSVFDLRSTEDGYALVRIISYLRNRWLNECERIVLREQRDLLQEVVDLREKANDLRRQAAQAIHEERELDAAAANANEPEKRSP